MDARRRVVVVRCEGTASQLSEEVTKFKTGGDAPYRLAIHPSGRTLVLGMTLGGVMGVDIEPSTSGRPEDPPILSKARGDGRGMKLIFVSRYW